MIAPARRDTAKQEESLDTRRAGGAIAPRPTRRPSGQRTMPGPSGRVKRPPVTRWTCGKSRRSLA